MLRTIVMVVIAGGVTWGLIALARDGNGTDELLINVRILGIILAADVIWAVSYTIWPRRAPSSPAVGAH